MTIARVVVSALVASCVAPPCAQAKPCWNGGQTRRLDVARLSRSSPWTKLSAARRRVVERKARRLTFANLQPIARHRFVGSWLRCKPIADMTTCGHPVFDRCELFVGIVAETSHGVTVKHRLSMGAGWRSDRTAGAGSKGTAPNYSTLLDVNGDGKRELVLDYWISGKEMCGSGMIENSQRLAVFAFDQKRVHRELALAAEGPKDVMSQLQCKVRYLLRDVGCTSHPAFIYRTRCERPQCGHGITEPPCEHVRTRTVYDYHRKRRRYVARRVARVTSGPAWVVVHRSIDLDARGARAQAEKARAHLVRRGFADAAVIDSARYAGLTDGYLVVIGGRFASLAKANAVAAKIHRKKLGAYVKRALPAPKAKP